MDDYKDSRMDDTVNNSRSEQLSGSKSRVACPFCSSVDTECFSLFGQQLLTMQYYCNACHTPFEYVKDDAAMRARGVPFNVLPS